MGSERLQTQTLMLQHHLIDITHPNTQFLLLSPHRCFFPGKQPPQAFFTGLIHANLRIEGRGGREGWRRRRFSQNPSVCSLWALQAAVTRFGVLFEIKPPLPWLCTAVFKQRKEREGCRDGVVWRERKRHQLTPGSAVRHAGNAQTAAAGTSHLQPPKLVAWSQPQKAAQLLHEYS